jgi:uncharacterized protein
MPTQFAFAAATFEGSLVAVAIILGWLFHQPPLKTFRFDPNDAAWGLVATLPLLGILWGCLKTPWKPLQEITRILDETLVPLFQGCGLTQLAIIAALAGVGEEMLFRGIVQTFAAEQIGQPYGVWGGLLVSAVVFGLLHTVTTTYAVMAGLIGLFLGWLWLATGNLLTPMIAHGAYDFVALVYLIQRRNGNSETDDLRM